MNILYVWYWSLQNSQSQMRDQSFFSPAVCSSDVMAARGGDAHRDIPRGWAQRWSRYLWLSLDCIEFQHYAFKYIHVNYDCPDRGIYEGRYYFLTMLILTYNLIIQASTPSSTMVTCWFITPQRTTATRNTPAKLSTASLGSGGEAEWLLGWHLQVCKE